MSRSTVIFALILAVALAAAALVLLKPAPPPPEAVSADFEPSAVTDLVIARPGLPTLRVRRGQSAGDWRVLTGEADHGWPVLAERVRPALRILAGSVVADDGGAQPPPADAPSITIRLDDGSERTLRIGQRVLAGRAPAELITPHGRTAGLIGADVADAFITTGPLAWRDLSVFPLAGPEVSRIHAAAGDRRISLARIQGHWRLAEPLSAPADRDAVAKLIATLAAAQISSFAEGPAEQGAAASALATTTASILIEAVVREPAGESTRSRTISNGLVVGTSSDLAGQRVFARLRRSTPDTPDQTIERIVSIERRSLDAISTDPTHYLSKTAVESAAGDIVSLSASVADDTASFQRGLDGWAPANAPSAPIVPDDDAGLAATTTLLAETPAAQILLTEPQGATPLARIEMSDLAGDPIGPVELSAVVAADEVRLVARNGPVWRVYAAEESAPVLRWLQRLAAEAAQPSPLP